jgi:2OG-Fe(II) oxygenase superfamily
MAKTIENNRTVWLMHMLNLSELKSALVKTDPFPYFYLERSVEPDHIQSLIDVFPDLEKGGSFNVKDIETPEKLRQFVDLFDSAEVRQIIEEKFDVDLTDKPMMATLRGYSRAKDGRIHTDSRTKLITILVYFNESWEPETGRLRILRSGNDLEDFSEELSPGPGSMVVFKVTDNCWHGYPSFEGKRQAIQINFLTGEGARAKHQFFHGLSAKLKSLFR